MSGVVEFWCEQVEIDETEEEEDETEEREETRKNKDMRKPTESIERGGARKVGGYYKFTWQHIGCYISRT